MKLQLHSDTVVLAAPDRSLTLAVRGTETLLLAEAEARILPFLDGARDLQTVVADSGSSPLVVLGLIHSLQKQGLLVHSPAGRLEKPDPDMLAGAPIGLSIGDSMPDFVDEFCAFAPTVSSPHRVEVVVAEDLLDPFIETRAAQSGGPWFPVSVSASQIRIGPMFDQADASPDQPCWECLAHQLRAGRGPLDFARALHGTIPAASPPPFVQRRAAYLAARFALDWLAVSTPRDSRATLLAWENSKSSPTPTRHAVRRRPRCPRCGTAAPVEAAPVVLCYRSVVGTGDAGLRTCDPDETLERLGHLVSPITGIVTHLAPVPGSEGLHVYTAQTHPHRTPQTWEQLAQSQYFFAGGKGTTAAQAKVSALAEALERFSARPCEDDHFLPARYNDISDRAIHPRELLHFSEGQYATRADQPPTSPMYRIPPPFDEDVVTRWTQVWSLSQSDWKFVPASFCYLGTGSESEPCPGDSNGNAAGNNPEEAILQGLLELVERDATALWWYNKIRRPAVSLDGIDDDFVTRMVEAYNKLDRTFWLLDLTSDLGIPTFVAITSSRTKTHLCTGFGTHPDPRVAALRALTEMSQLLPHILRFAQREDRLASGSSQTSRRPILADADFNDERVHSELSHILPDPATPPKAMRDFVLPEASRCIGDALRHCLRRIEGLGLETLVLDLTRPDVGLPVFKVIVPGLRHYVRRLGPGRLYDVPIKLGWLKRPLSESELNPWNLTP